MIAGIGLGLSVISAGLWSGLLLTLTTILHPMYAARDAAGFSRDMRRFLPVARRSPTNYVLVSVLLLAPITALIGLRGEPASPPFVLAAVGTVATLAGPLVASRFFAEPNYGVILSWDPDEVPDDWRIARTRYFRLNWLRAALTWTSFALFLTAAYLHFT